MIGEKEKLVLAIAGYTRPIKDKYDPGAFWTVKAFTDVCRDGGFLDYDGFGHPVKDKMINIAINVYPSSLDEIPEDATHIVWYNK